MLRCFSGGCRCPLVLQDAGFSFFSLVFTVFFMYFDQDEQVIYRFSATVHFGVQGSPAWYIELSI